MAQVTVLALLTSASDRQALRRIIGHSNWNLVVAEQLVEALAVIGEGSVGVVISDTVLPDGHSWKDLLQELEVMPAAPPLIVCSRQADDRLWGEVLNLGAYDLLVTPFVAKEVFRIIGLAWLSWKQRADSAARLRKAPASEVRHGALRSAVSA